MVSFFILASEERRNPREPEEDVQAHAKSSSNLLEVEAEFTRQCARRDVVRAAERGQEIVERLLVGQVDDCEPQAPLVPVTVEEVVISNGGIKQAPGSNPRRILVIILRARHRNFYEG